MKKAKVSVIIPAYNASQYLGRALDSVLGQDIDTEIIVIDDASDDPIDQVMEKYKSCPQLLYVKNQKNLGVAASRNLGVMLSQGDYVAFLDADDWWEPGKLQAQLDIVDKTGTALTYTGRKIHYGDMVQPYRVPEVLTYEELLKCNYIACSSVLLERQLAKDYPMSQEAGIHEDYLTWLQILKTVGKVHGLPECYLDYLVHKDSRSGSKFRSLMMRIHTYRRAGLSRTKTLKYNVGYYGRWLTGFRKETI